MRHMLSLVAWSFVVNVLLVVLALMFGVPWYIFLPIVFAHGFLIGTIKPRGAS